MRDEQYKVLALDPSSTCTGYAVMRAAGERLIECGLLKPQRKRDDANTRIRAMATEARRLLAEHHPRFVVIEDTSGKVARRARGRGVNGAGLAIHGKAVGYLLASLEKAGVIGCSVESVAENLWTRGVPKARRKLIVTQVYGGSGYEPDRDPGGDAADAVGLARWFIVTRRNTAGAAA